ncbi:resolvase [Vibrio tapetis]|uniref:IS630 family transposase-like protein n=1 Tax=Vibrio tapetis TaxID=52443 RepID=B2LSD0_9VIBR|nr:resolvase [Vibrio tapetis]ACB99676.1 IS630 family transposase-like protein [Vibrio tapetis]
MGIELRPHIKLFKTEAGATIGQLAREFRLGEASIYRALSTVRQSSIEPELKTTKVILWLQVENNSKLAIFAHPPI